MENHKHNSFTVRWVFRRGKNNQRSDTDKKGRNKRKGGQHTETYTHIDTKSRDRKDKQEPTGFDIEGHSVSAVLIGGIAEGGDVRGHLEMDHTAEDALFGLLLGHCLDDLAHRRRDKDTKKKVEP